VRLVDLSVLVENSPSEPLKMKSERLDHYEGAKQFCAEVATRNEAKQPPDPRRLNPEDFPDSAFITLDTVTLPTHMGTHIDAPVHYGPECEGKSARSVDELPLEWFYAPGVRLDLRHKEAGAFITPEDLETALLATGHKLQPLDIVLIWTGTDKLWGKREYFSHAPGMSREATEWLTQQGIKVIGIDTYGFDRPFVTMLEDFWRTGDRRFLWAAHFYGRECEYIQIERLANLDQLPDTGFQVSCFPLRVKGLDASWVRAVGIVETEPT
jgi:kynurenine formamidase